METLVSSWSRTAQILPENYVFPVRERPGSDVVPSCQNIQLIDLAANQGKSQSQTIEEILAACQEFGFFQVFKNGQWLGVEPLPEAFVVNIGHQLQVISNGKLRSAEHRVVTNSQEARTTIVSFISPLPDTIIEPAKSMVVNSVPLYRTFKFKDFLKFFEGKKGDT